MEKKNIIVTAGGVSEKIDEVRKITNSATGKLGVAIVEELLKEKGESIFIYYICVKESLKPTRDNRIKVIEIEGVIDLKNVVEELLIKEKISYFIHSMAVSDYSVEFVTNTKLLAATLAEHPNENIQTVLQNNPRNLTGSKISSHEQDLVIFLKPTPKVISLIKKISPATFLVGFKLLDGVSDMELIRVAKSLRDTNQCDLVVANDLVNIRRGNHKAFIIGHENDVIAANGKLDIAQKLVKKMGKNWDKEESICNSFDTI